MGKWMLSLGIKKVKPPTTAGNLGGLSVTHLSVDNKMYF